MSPQLVRYESQCELIQTRLDGIQFCPDLGAVLRCVRARRDSSPLRRVLCPMWGHRTHSCPHSESMTSIARLSSSPVIERYARVVFVSSWP